MNENAHPTVEPYPTYRALPLSSKVWFVAFWLLLIFPIGLIMLASRKTYYHKGGQAIPLSQSQKILLGGLASVLFAGVVFAGGENAGAVDSDPSEFVGLSAAPADQRSALSGECGSALRAYETYIDSGDSSYIAVADRRAMECHSAAAKLAATLERLGSQECAEWVLAYPVLVDDFRTPTLQIRSFLTSGDGKAYAMEVADQLRELQLQYLRSGAACLTGDS